MIRKIAAALTFALALVLAGQGASAQTPPKKVSFLANYSFHGRHVPFFVGVEKGFFKDAGFDLEVLPTSGSGFVVTAVDGGKADFGMADPSTVVQAIAKGAKVQAFGVFIDAPGGGLASLKPYPTLESIGNHSVAASVTDASRVVLPMLYAQKGLDPASINWLSSDPSVYVSLLSSGKADMYTATLDGDVPVITKLFAAQGKQAYFQGFSDWGYDVFGYFFLTRADRIANRPDEVKAFAGALAKSVLYSTANPEEGARIMVKRNPILIEETVLAQWRQAAKAIDTPYMREHGYGIAGVPRLQRTIDLVKVAMKLDLKLTPDEIYAQGFMPRQ